MSLKLLGQNTVLYAIGNVGLRFGSFLLIPLYTYSMDIEHYGMLVTLLMTIQIMMCVISFGTPTGFMRFADEYEREGKFGELIGSTISIQMLFGIILTMLSVTFLVPFFRVILHTQDVLVFVLLTGLAATFQSLFDHIISYFRVKNEAFKFMVVSILGFLFLVAANYTFLKQFNWGINGALLAQVATYSILWFAVLIHTCTRSKLSFNYAGVKRLFKFSYPLIFAISGFMVTDVTSV